MLITFIFAVLVSFIVAFLLTPVVKNIFIAHNWIEDPRLKQKKSHNATASSSVPRGGGIPIFFAVLVTSFIFLPPTKHLFGILFGALIALIVGVVDDVKDLSPKVRLFTNLFSSLVVVGSGIGIAYLSNPFGSPVDLSYPRLAFSLFGPHSIWLIADLLAIIWIVWCQNIVGWAAGVEGQLPGYVAISAIFIGILGLRYSQDINEFPVIILSAAIAGAYLGFLPFNFFPQKIMPGYSGKSLAGFFLAVLSILSGAKVATLILLLGIPMIDAVFVIVRRLRQKKSIFISDGNHFHHQLLKLGWSRQSIAILYWIFSFILGLISLFLNSQQKFYLFIAVFFLFSGIVLKVSRRI
jgi:UDP-GlcNAc:undecaprenyl-phosphate/decaprenyl-phosphate GlcNAc-1-phosphate transferase